MKLNFISKSIVFIAFSLSISINAQTTKSKETELKDIVMYKMGLPEGQVPSWAIGPFEIGKVNDKPMIFRPSLHWKDPLKTKDWTPTKFWNPTLMEKDGKLFLFYRTGPVLEGLDSRIGVAWSEDGLEWHDYENNPIIYPTEKNETMGCEDPRIYKYNDTYYMYYNAVWDMKDKKDDIYGNVGVDICLATSKDLLHWEKKGVVVPRSISKGWAKAPVIPRSPEGEAIKIDGNFIMYISERPYESEEDTKEQLIGYSKDLINWKFEQKPYLSPNENIKSIYEVASTTTNLAGSDDIVMDVYYIQPDGEKGCAQVLYNKKDPSKKIDFTSFGLCSWGGFILYKNEWLFAQGWVDPEAIYFYKAPINRTWIKVEDIRLDKRQFNRNRKIIISVHVKNIGKTSGKRTISLFVNDEINSTKEVFVDAEKSTKVDFIISKQKKGLYNIVVDDKSVSYELSK